MPIVNGYLTEVQLREHLGDGGSKLDTDLLIRAINATSRAIDKHCGRRFWQDSAVVARTYRPRDTTVAFVDDISTSAGLIIATDTTGDGTYATTWATTDYQMEPLNAAADGKPWWMIAAIDAEAFPVSDLRATLRVTAKFGRSAVPAEVEQAAILKASRLFRRKDSPDGIRGFGEFGPVRVSKFEDPDVVDLLDDFVRVARPDV